MALSSGDFSESYIKVVKLRKETSKVVVFDILVYLVYSDSDSDSTEPKKGVESGSRCTMELAKGKRQLIFELTDDEVCDLILIETI